MSTITRISLVLLVALAVLVGFVRNPDVGMLLLVVLFPLLIVVVTGLMRRILFLAYLWLLLTLAFRSILIAVLVSPTGSLERTPSLLIWLVSPVLALLVAAGGVLAILYVSSEWVLSMSGYLGVTRGQALRVLASLVFDLQYAYQIIEDGMVMMASPSRTMSTLGGPGLLVLRPANAAVLEWGGLTSRVVGPGMVRTKLFERVKRALDLRPQTGICRDCEVLTRDGVPLHLTARFSYRIETVALSGQAPAESRPTGPVDPGFSGPLDGQPEYDQDAVFRAVYEAGLDGWQTATKNAVDAALHDAMGRRSLTDLFGDPTNPATARPDAMRAVADEACEGAWRRTSAWGVCVDMIDIVTLSVPEGLAERVLATWHAAADSDVVRSRGQAEAEVFDAIETVKMAARTRAMEDVARFAERAAGTLPPAEVGQFITLLDKLAVEMSRDRVTAIRYLQTLEAMSRNPNARVILSTGDSEILIGADD